MIKCTVAHRISSGIWAPISLEKLEQNLMSVGPFLLRRRGRWWKSTVEPVYKVHVLSKKNWPYKRVDLISGLYCSIANTDWDQPKIDRIWRPYIRGPYTRAPVYWKSEAIEGERTWEFVCNLRLITAGWESGSHFSPDAVHSADGPLNSLWSTLKLIESNHSTTTKSPWIWGEVVLHRLCYIENLCTEHSSALVRVLGCVNWRRDATSRHAAS